MIKILTITEKDHYEFFHKFIPDVRAHDLIRALSTPAVTTVIDDDDPDNYDFDDGSRFDQAGNPIPHTNISQDEIDIHKMFNRDRRMILLQGDMAVTTWLGEFAKSIGYPKGKSEIMLLLDKSETRPLAEIAVVICALRKAFPNEDMAEIIDTISNHPIYRLYLQDTLNHLPWLLNNP